MTLDLVQGWTGAVPLTLEADGAAPSVSASNFTISAQLYDKDGTEVDATGDVSVTDPAAWEIDWFPDAADLDVDLSPYELRFKARDAGGKDVFFPNGDPIRVKVRR